MAAHIPCMLHSNPQTIAVIGVGVGQTAKRFLLYPVQRLDCIDIEHSVFSFIRQYFSGAWLDDQRVRMIVDDGRDYITHTLNRYDIISIEIGQIFRPQCAAFYSREFYRSLKQALNPGGLVSQFVPLAFLDHEFFLRTIGTFIEAFPNSTLWFNGNELLLIGTQDATITLDTARLLSLLGHKDISKDCSFSLWGGKANSFSRIETIAASFLCGGKKLSRITKGESILTDDRPELEYATARHQQYQVSAMNAFMDFLAGQCDPVDSILKNSLPDSTLKKIAFTRTYNLRNVKAVCYLQEYVRTGIGDYLKNAFAENPFNLDIIMYTGKYAARRGDIADARQLYYQALKIDSTFSPAYNNLGSLEEQRGNLVEATRLYGKAVQVDSMNPEANFNIANMYVKRDEPDSAIFFLKKTLQLKPDNERAKNILAGLELKRKKK
jgi:spermidine synthase